MFSFFLAVADGVWILFGAGIAVQGNCQGLSPIHDEKGEGPKAPGSTHSFYR